MWERDIPGTTPDLFTFCNFFTPLSYNKQLTFEILIHRILGLTLSGIKLLHMRLFLMVGMLGFLLLASCVNKSHSFLVKAETPLNAASSCKGDADSGNRPEAQLDSNGTKSTGEENLPPARYSWDTKMVLW